MLPFQPVTCMLSEHAGLLMPLLYSPILIWQWVVGVDIGLTKKMKKTKPTFPRCICKWSVGTVVQGLVAIGREFQGDERWHRISNHHPPFANHQWGRSGKLISHLDKYIAFCSVKQALVVDSWVKEKVDKWAWLTGRPDLGWDEDFSRKSLSLSSLCSSSFLCFSSVLDKEPFGLKVLAKSKINCSDIKGAFDSSKDQ